jgi:putative addiction module killer protein
MVSEIHILLFRKGRLIPFSKWLRSLRDARVVSIVRARLNRIRLGNFGDCKPVGDGVEELRIDFGPGYRVYYGREGSLVVILLCGGDKKSQPRDIRLAQEYWKEYLDAKTVD